jgi:hypothetical protein
MGIRTTWESLPCCKRAGSIDSDTLTCENCGGMYDEQFNYIGKMNTKPITPGQARTKRTNSIPDEVLEAFNELIVENLRGRFSCFRQEAVEKRIMEKLKVSNQHIYESRWLDVEEIYRNAGWEVKYDAPGYNENYPATFDFTAPK